MGSIDQTTLIGIVAAIAIILALTIVFGLTRRRQSLRREQPPAEVEARRDPFPATRERPYMKAATPPPAEVPPAPEPVQAPPPPPTAVASGVPLDDEDVDVAPPPVPLAGDFAGIAFPPHSTDHPDELTKLKGVGPKLAAMLNDHGITRYEQLASLDGEELSAIEERLGAFKGRLTRDRVVEQARLLASGDTAGFEATFGKLGG
jgi:predicted flap endonuclease-1-like 5' DNA nuclease